MQVVADRFVCTDPSGEALDLATAERVRLFVDGGLTRAAVAARTAACDRLANLRHPLLVPLLDYGAHGRDWFEAYALAGPVPLMAGARRRAVLHLVRFLRAAGVELTAQMATRGVASAADASGARMRPVGVFLRERAALEVVRTLLESDGPAGTTVVDVAATAGAGLRTFRLQVARLARLAGFVVLDTRMAAAPWPSHPARHVCALDWLPRRHALPRAMAEAAADGARRHLWIRFCREAIDRGAVNNLRAIDPRPFLRLEPMMRDELTEAIFPDPQLGPTAAEVRTAVDASGGMPGRAVAALSGPRTGAGAAWVHEASPEYSGEPEPARPPLDAGTSRLRRAIEAARTFAARGRHAQAARLFERGAAALAARGAGDAAALAACDLGELMLHRAQPTRAAAAFAQAREWSRDATVTLRALVGAGRAFYELDRMRDAEAAFRTAAAASEEAAARVWLARTLWRRGELDAARHAVGDACPALLSRILLQAGQVEEAAIAARQAVGAVEARPDDACDAHTAAAHVHAAMRDADGVRRHLDAAMRAANRMRHPARRFEVAAERWACLERCGVSAPGKARDRLLRVAARLPPRAGAAIRMALGHHSTEPAVRVAPPVDLVAHFQHLIDATHDAADEAAALQRIAAGVLAALGACSVVIRSARPNQIAGAAGRPWPGEAALALPILNGGASVTHDGVTPDAVVAIAAAGAIVGSLSVRWIAGDTRDGIA